MILNRKLDLRTTVLLSGLLAVVLNIWQFIDTTLQRRDAFAPSWAYADNPTATTTAGGKANQIQSGSSPRPLTATASTSASASASAAPAPVPAPTVAARLASAGLKPDYAAIYLSVQERTGTPWQLLAAVHKTETGQRGNTSTTSYAGAQGPMQFMPATFSHYAADGDGDGTTSITDLDDAMLTAGRYLAAGGATRGQYSTALYHYNHSWSYVSQVMGTAKKLGL
jgi:membrane-bound lytic murein transglycosylase B